MACAYTTPITKPEALPSHLRVHVLVMREDGRDLTAEDLAAAKAAYPAPEGAAVDAGVIGKTPVRKAAKPRASKGSPKRATSKRAAAKRPSR